MFPEFLARENEIKSAFLKNFPQLILAALVLVGIALGSIPLPTRIIQARGPGQGAK